MEAGQEEFGMEAGQEEELVFHRVCFRSPVNGEASLASARACRWGSRV